MTGVQTCALPISLDVDALPRSGVLRGLPEARQREFTLAGGDDYELVFTAAADRAAQVQAAAVDAQVAVTRIGRIDAQPGLRLLDANGLPVAQRFASFDHFLS